MTGTSLVLLTIYSTLNLLAPHHPIAPAAFPWLLALLMAAACLTCFAVFSKYHVPKRRRVTSSTIGRRFAGPGARRH
ncbi:MAG: hypothetical protein JSS20_05630 [Proteobacteria bacterium]|nr:hypothetical protein [Pseudomonadota bacterium]